MHRIGECHLKQGSNFEIYVHVDQLQNAGVRVHHAYYSCLRSRNCMQSTCMACIGKTFTHAVCDVQGFAWLPHPMYTWHRCRLQDANGNSVVVVRASDNQGAVFLGLRQLWQLFASPSLSYGSFFSRAAQCGKLYPTSPMDRIRMFRLGAIGTHASAAKLTSLTTAFKTLRWFSCSTPMLGRIQTLRDLGNCELVGDDARLLMLNQPPELTPLNPAPSQSLPLTLPPCLLSSQQLSQRYGLLSSAKHLISQFPLKQEMQELKAWSQRSIQLDRDGVAIRARTWEGVEKVIYLYLGFIHAFPQHSDPPSEALSRCTSHCSLCGCTSGCRAFLQHHQQYFLSCEKGDSMAEPADRSGPCCHAITAGMGGEAAQADQAEHDSRPTGCHSPCSKEQLVHSSTAGRHHGRCKGVCPA